MARREIQGCRAVVTGASGGIGRAMALELSHHGVSMVIVARREEKLRSLAEEIATDDRAGSSAPAVEIVVGDVTDSEVRRRVIDQAKTALGGLDILINNAGVNAFARFAESDETVLREVMEINFFAAVELIRTGLPLLQQGSHPVVVNVGSILGRRGLPWMSSYCASKFALQGFTESLRMELAPWGIDVLTVCPGTTDTEIYDQAIEGAGKSPWNRRRGRSPESVAQAIVRAIERGKRQITPSLSGRLLLWANAVAPGFLDRYLQRYA